MRVFRISAVLLIGVATVGCAETSTMQLSKDTIQITVSAEDCGMASVQRIATRRAAIETISQGYDSFIIFGANAQSDTSVVGYTAPNAYGYGGGPVFAMTHGQAINVKMFKNGDPAAENALSARSILGADWRKIVAEEATQAEC